MAGMSRLDPERKLQPVASHVLPFLLYSSFMMHAVHYMRKMFIKKVRKYVMIFSPFFFFLSINQFVFLISFDYFLCGICLCWLLDNFNSIGSKNFIPFMTKHLGWLKELYWNLVEKRMMTVKNYIWYILKLKTSYAYEGQKYRHTS